jgi:hypothetical protein
MKARSEFMFMLDDRLFDQEWIQELPSDARWLFLYMLAKASKKTGIIELNMRQLNFNAATEHRYTKEDVIRMYGGRIKLIPNYENTAIIVNYIKVNWMRGDNVNMNSPLFRGIRSELARYGLTIEDVCNADSLGLSIPVSDEVAEKEEDEGLAVKRKTCETYFDMFWKAYPNVRKVDKKKCLEVFTNKAMAHKEGASKFAQMVMSGLDRWKKSADWTKNDGQFICAPLVWLRNDRWEAEIKEGGQSNGSQTWRSGGNSASKFKDEAEASSIFG